MKLEYINASTGEVTENHNEAVQWYSSGDDVDLYSVDNDYMRYRTTWFH